MQFGAIQRLIDPVHEPVSLGEMRAHLRVEHHLEDSIISACIKGARAHVESTTRRAIIRQQWQAELTGNWSAGRAFDIPRPRIIEVISVEYRNSTQAWTASTDYGSRIMTEPGRIWLLEDPGDLDDPGHATDALWRMTYWSGYGELPNNVPDDLRIAIKMLAAHYYENRIVADTVPLYAVPRGVEALLAPYRVPWGGTNL
jgi:uncharacterized phiE125 gp8 family phage protein